MRTRRLTFALALVPLLACCGSGGSDAAPGPAAVTTTGAPTATESPVPSPSATDVAGPSAPEEKAVAPENNPPGDIPDNLAFVRYENKPGRYAFTHPEGWAETVAGKTVTFTDKLNGVHVEVGSATAAPTVAEARKIDVPALEQGRAAFQLKSVMSAKINGWSGVKIVYRRNSEADPVTGRQYRDEVERYEIVSASRELIVELYGPVGADNVDAYRTMIDSLKAT